MVVVTIELWPHGERKHSLLIGRAVIANDGTGDADHGNYEVQLAHAGRYAAYPGVWRQGKVTKHLRKLSPYHLVLAALKAAL